MSKYRVIKEDGLYIPQKYSWFRWRYFYYYSNMSGVPIKDIIKFSNKESASDFMFDQTRYMQKVEAPVNIVLQYEE